jgi:hypothetical protein
MSVELGTQYRRKCRFLSRRPQALAPLSHFEIKSGPIRINDQLPYVAAVK